MQSVAPGEILAQGKKIYERHYWTFDIILSVDCGLDNSIITVKLAYFDLCVQLYENVLFTGSIKKKIEFVIIRVLQELLVTCLFSSVSSKLYQNKVSKQGKDKHPLNKREPLVARLAVDGRRVDKRTAVARARCLKSHLRSCGRSTHQPGPEKLQKVWRPRARR